MKILSDSRPPCLDHTNTSKFPLIKRIDVVVPCYVFYKIEVRYDAHVLKSNTLNKMFPGMSSYAVVRSKYATIKMLLCLSITESSTIITSFVDLFLLHLNWMSVKFCSCLLLLTIHDPSSQCWMDPYLCRQVIVPCNYDVSLSLSIFNLSVPALPLSLDDFRTHSISSAVGWSSFT